MTKQIHFDWQKAAPFLSAHELEHQSAIVQTAHQMLHEKTGPGNDYLGWIDLPIAYDKAEFARIKAAATRIRLDSDALVVIGIGGSYLGARATIEALTHAFYNQLPKEQRNGPQVFFLGKDISPVYMNQLLQVLEGKDVSVNVISKSGTTTEPAIAFRVMRAWMEQKYGKEGAAKRIYATTDRARGALKSVADKAGYETFVIPDDVGGRYSVLTAVGLLPIAAAGVDIDQLMQGAADAMKVYGSADLAKNPAYQYAAARNALYRKGKEIELFVTYEPALHLTAEWWKQLYGESEGKDQKGIFPASVEFTTDLHSMGQYIQEGRRSLFETVIQVAQPASNVTIQEEAGDPDGLNFLAGKTMDFVNKKAFEGTLLAHMDGGVPSFVLTMPELTPYYYGQLIYFFEKACGLSGYLLGVNPFDQPGVEAYKKNMFALLGKPGFEEQKAALEKRL